MENELLKNLLELDALTLSEFKDYLNQHIVEICSTHGTNAQIVQEHSKNEKICLKCNCKFHKNGHTRSGVQKYICPMCGDTSSETTGTITYCSKLPFEIWKNVIDNLIDGLSIRRIAKKNKITIQTSFSLRHKILLALKSFLNTIIFSGEVQGDEKYLKINLKGTKPSNMPRLSKKRSSSGSAGISKHSICVLTLKDDKDNLLLEIGGLSRVSNKMLEDNLNNRIEENSTLTTDSASAYQKFCKDNKLIHIAIPSGRYADNNGNNLADINGVHSQLEIWMSKFHGISTRHLQSYLDWFTYIFIMLKKFEHYKLESQMCKNIIPDTNYIKSLNIFKKEFPIDLYDAYGEYHYGIYA